MVQTVVWLILPESEAAMSFQSLAFFGFLAAVIASCLLAGRRSLVVGKILLSAACLVFYLNGVSRPLMGFAVLFNIRGIKFGTVPIAENNLMYNRRLYRRNILIIKKTVKDSCNFITCGSFFRHHRIVFTSRCKTVTGRPGKSRTGIGCYFILIVIET